MSPLPAPSPFIPGTNIQWCWDSTSLGWLKECARKYQYHMIEGWIPRGEKLHLKFGLLYHAALERFDRLRAEGADHEGAVRGALLDLLSKTWERKAADTDPAGMEISAISRPWDSGDSYKNRGNLVRAFIWYTINFKDDPAKTVILANGKPAVELTFKMELDFGPNVSHLYGSDISDYQGQPYVLSGHIDRLVTFLDGLYVTDRKTTKSSLYSGYFDQYTPDNQMTLYSLAAQVVFNTPVKGVLIDAVQIAVGFSRFARGMAYRTTAQLDEWVADTRVHLKMAESYAVDGYWPMNDKSCHRFGGCVFRDVCAKDSSVRQNFLKSEFERRFWNPAQER